jgi:hypothetical protein
MCDFEHGSRAAPGIAKNSKRKEDLGQSRCGRVSKKVRSLSSKKIAKVARKVVIALLKQKTPPSEKATHVFALLA